MSAIKKQTELIGYAWMVFDEQRSLRNTVTKGAAFADFLLLKEHI